jgi:hypothetical protein
VQAKMVLITQTRERDKFGRFSPDEGTRKAKRQEWVVIDRKEIKVADLIALSKRLSGNIQTSLHSI